jgi:hypothetical protein
MSEWQPIETYPGGDVLVWVYDWIHIAYRLGYDGLWYERSQDGDDVLLGVTHWMPLPEPPKASDDEPDKTKPQSRA